ncbi:MAG: RNA polymerase sigma factor [Xanthomonadales bacterium]|nr:RNA polymerase sigma factor [Xanthomonadales bacterium]
MAADGDHSDEQLALDWARGDQAAFRCLYARHKGRLYAFLLRCLGRRDAADDCFQETWARAIGAIGRWRPQARFSTWLLQIAHNLAVDRMRRQRPLVSIDDDEGPLPGSLLLDGGPHADPAAALEALQEGRRLRRAIAALPPEQRTAVLLRLDAELPLEEIAQITGAGRETVKSRLRYAMDKLREALA